MVRTVALRYGGIALQFVILMVLARRLDPDEYGRYMLVLSAVLPTYFLLGLGVSETFVRDAPSFTDRGDLQQLNAAVGATLSVACGSAVVIAAVGGLAILLLPLSTVTSAVVAFILAFFVANGLMFNGAQLLLGAGAPTLAAFFFYPAVNLSLMVSAVPYVLLVTHPTFDGIAVATSLAALVIAAVSILLVVKRVHPGRFQLHSVWNQVKVGVRLSAARGLYAVGIWLPTFIAGVALAPVQAGYMGTAGRLAVAVGAVTAAVRFAIRPAIVRASQRQDHHAIKSICGNLATVTLVIACAALILSEVAGKKLISVAFGSDFTPAAPLLTILLIAVGIEAFAGPVDEVLKMTGHENAVLAIFCVTLPVAAAALLGVAHIGVTAMAWVQVAYTLAVFGAMILLVRRRWGIWLHPTIPKTLKVSARSEQAF
jgi:O-antigen/teichoic acid export membrane protein